MFKLFYYDSYFFPRNFCVFQLATPLHVMGIISYCSLDIVRIIIMFIIRL